MSTAQNHKKGGVNVYEGSAVLSKGDGKVSYYQPIIKTQGKVPSQGWTHYKEIL